MKFSSKWTRTFIPMFLILLPVCIQGFVVARLGVNVLIYDEFDTISFVKQVFESPNWLAAVPGQHNEHRMVTMRLVLALLSRLTGWNVVAQMYFSLLLAALILLGLWLIYRKSVSGTSLWAFVPIAWLFFSLGQYENMLYGIQLVFYFMVLGAVWAVYFLLRPSLQATLGAGLCAVLASFSINSGLLVWPVGFAMLFAQKAKKSRFVLWALLSTLTVFLYYWNYAPVTYHPSPLLALGQPVHTVEFALATLGAPLGGGNVSFALVMGIGQVICLLLLLYRMVKSRRWPTRVEISGGGLILLSLFSAGAIAVGRMSFGLEFALTSRYTTLTTLGVIGAYLMLIEPDQTNGIGQMLRQRMLPAYVCVVIIGLAATNLYGWYMANQWHAEQLKNKYILQTYESQPDYALARLFPLLDRIHQYVPFLKEAHLNAFRDRTDMLLLTRWQVGTMSAEILPERPLIQSFTCNVQTMWDFSVALDGQGHGSPGQLSISLHEGDQAQPIVTRALSLSELKENDWVGVRLEKPVSDCAGRQLSVSIQSPDAVAGFAAKAWTYPPYYEGRLSQMDKPTGADYLLGLQINTLTYNQR
jgi:hypothetical protein